MDSFSRGYRVWMNLSVETRLLFSQVLLVHKLWRLSELLYCRFTRLHRLLHQFTGVVLPEYCRLLEVVLFYTSSSSSSVGQLPTFQAGGRNLAPNINYALSEYQQQSMLIVSKTS